MPYSYMLASCQDYQIRQQGEVTWEQGPIRALASITLQRNLISTTCWGCPEHLLATISWHWLRLACSGWPAGFHSMRWSSKLSFSSEYSKIKWRYVLKLFCAFWYTCLAFISMPQWCSDGCVWLASVPADYERSWQDRKLDIRLTGEFD